MSSVQVVEVGRAKRPAIFEALRVIREESRAGSVGKLWRICLQQIGSKDKKVAGLLSRRNMEEARAIVAQRQGCCVDGTLDHDFVRGSELRVLNAIRLMEKNE